jgi:N utilization substance protein B
MRKRTKAREIALQILYQMDIVKSGASETTDKYWQGTDDKPEAEILEFSNRLVRGVSENMGRIDEIISTYAKNWEIKRMAVVDRNIIRMAAYELIFLEDIPPKVSLNEAIDIAKKYGDEDSGKFVNGILDRINKEVSPNAK